MSGTRRCRQCKSHIAADNKGCYVCELNQLVEEVANVKIPKQTAVKKTIKQASKEVLENHATLFERLAKTDTGGTKHDNSKPDYALLSPTAINKVAQVMTFGKAKYDAHNWRKGIVYSRLLAAALRHTFSYLDGETLDPESKVSHLAHAICCLSMVLEFEETRPDLDDRYKKD